MMRIPIIFRPGVPLLVCMVIASHGCGGASPPAPADPVQARVALRLALESWQKGTPADTLTKYNPPVQVVDHEWRTGFRLVRYQVGKDEPLGANLRCQVLLSLQKGRGKPLQKKAVYSIGTHPVLTVVREEDP